MKKHRNRAATEGWMMRLVGLLVLCFARRGIKGSKLFFQPFNTFNGCVITRFFGPIRAYQIIIPCWLYLTPLSLACNLDGSGQCLQSADRSIVPINQSGINVIGHDAKSLHLCQDCGGKGIQSAPGLLPSVKHDTSDKSNDKLKAGIEKTVCYILDKIAHNGIFIGFILFFWLKMRWDAAKWPFILPNSYYS